MVKRSRTKKIKLDPTPLFEVGTLVELDPEQFNTKEYDFDFLVLWSDDPRYCEPNRLRGEKLYLGEVGIVVGKEVYEEDDWILKFLVNGRTMYLVANRLDSLKIREVNR